MSENSQEIPEKFPGNSGTILTGSGISYAQIPRSIFKLKKQSGITAGDSWLAATLFDWCHNKRKFPEFEISYADMAKESGLSSRQVKYSIQRLIDLRLISARLVTTKVSRYKWNEYMLNSGDFDSAKSAQALVKNLHKTGANSAQALVQKMHHIYIEFILDHIYILYREYFASNQSLVKRIPGKRRPKGEPQDCGSKLYVTRKAAWSEAIEEVVRSAGYMRTYVALAGGFNIDQVNHPRSYLKKVVWDESRQWEARKKSHLAHQGYLDDEESFLNFINSKFQKRGPHDQRLAEVYSTSAEATAET